MPKHKRGFIPSRYSLVQPIGTAGNSGTSSESKETLNILNGVLNCAWDKTSYSPKLLEVYENSQVKFNVSSDDPLVLAFANGWDDKDRPAQVVKRLAVAPSNIDLSAKAGCIVQICAKVINDELVITTHDIYDPAVGLGSNIIPNFSTGRGGTDAVATKDGWSVQSNKGYTTTEYPWRAVCRDGTASKWRAGSASSQALLILTPPFSLSVGGIGWQKIYTTPNYFLGYDADTLAWVELHSGLTNNNASMLNTTLSSAASLLSYTQFAFSVNGGSGACEIAEVELYERPTAKFFRSLNKVKDRSDVEQLWINLGYATMDGSGNITALTHYTDLRNNYPGGMRVEV